MRNISLLLIAFFIIIHLSAQEFIPFPPDSTSEWRVDASYWNPDPWEITFLYKKYFFDGDTTIDALTYKRLYWSGKSTTHWSNGTVTSNSIMPHNVAGIRTEESKVYIYIFYSGEYLLFDYSLQPGDTVRDCYISESCEYDLIVSSVDSVQIGNRFHRRFNFENWGNVSWFIEGIGHEFGIPEIACIVPDRNSFFLCYAENHESIFPEGAVCDLTVQISEPYLTGFFLQVYPNPSSGLFSLAINSDQNKDISLLIIDATGRTILSEEWQINTGMNTKRINISSKKNGFYMMIIRGMHGEFIAKQKLTVF
nr:T9SS type A sorting domain-containing protein [Bacteroidota bacterium]